MTGYNMTDEKDLFPNAVGESTTTSYYIPDNIIVCSTTIEDILAKYLKDLTIEGDTVLGYIDDLDTFRDILDRLKELGFTFSVRDSDERQKQRERLQKDTLRINREKRNINQYMNHLTVFYQLKAMPIKFFGLPFTIDRTTHYQCAYGLKYYKSRTSSKRKSENADEPPPKKKKCGSKKIGCLAKLTVKQITVYPEYQLNSEADWRRKKKLIEKLRKELSDNSKLVEQQQRFYLSVSIQAKHNHPPIITKPKPVDSTGTMVTPIPEYHRILVKPIQPIQPIQSIQPIETIDPLDPIQPIEPIEPIEPIDPLDPIQPIEPIDPLDPIQPIESIETIQAIQAIQAIQPVRTDMKDESMENSGIVSDEFYGNYVQLATASLLDSENEQETEQRDMTPRTLTLRDDNFFNTLLRFPNTTTNELEQVELKPNEIQIEIKPFEITRAPSVEVLEYQPTLQDLQILFKEKLKNLYTLCSNCTNGPLLLRLAGELEQVEIQLATEENFGSL